MNRSRLRKKRRLIILLSAMTMLALSLSLVLFAFKDNIVFFYGPSDVIEQKIGPGQNFRLGGLVMENSVSRAPDGVTNLFGVSDGVQEIQVAFKGILPDLFREGQGVVAQGSLDANGVFIAREVLAKHDETYMPPEVVDVMKRAGTWQGSGVKGEDK